MEKDYKETSPAIETESTEATQEEVTKSDKNGNSFSKMLDNAGISFLTFLYKNGELITMFVATVVALYAKIAIVQHPTKDVVGYIFKWMDEIQEIGYKNFYLVESDYSPLYLFFVSLISRIPKGEMIELSGFVYSSNWMMALKTCYYIFDIINAFSVYFIINHVTGSGRKATIGFLIMTALPVQLINSAVWGQADCIYTCFLLYSLYFALRGKSNLSFLMFGFAIANKLQAVFLAPFLIYMLLHRKIKLSSLICAPLAVLISFLPSYICGASFTQPFSFYESQLDGYSKLTLGCPNFWQLFSYRSARVETINRGAVFIALLFIGVFFAIVWLRMVRNSKVNLINIAAFLACTTVFFLPYMHERYFYSVDILVVVYAMCKGKRYYLIPLMQIASGIAYQNYIGGKYFINTWGEDSVHIAALIVIVVLGTLLYDILHSEHRTVDEVLEDLKEKCQ